MAEHVTITLRLPPKELSPNWRGHWAVKAKAVKRYKTDTHIETMRTMNALGMPWTSWESATARAVFFWGTRRHRDKDNALASLKAAFDGMASAGLLRDDEGLMHWPAVFEIDKSNPRVEITITKGADDG